jgi:hypothetical protein
MKPWKSVDDYFSKTLAITSKMKLHGDIMKDVTMVEKIPWSMTIKYNYIFCLIEESNNIDSLSIDELYNSLHVHKQKL